MDDAAQIWLNKRETTLGTWYLFRENFLKTFTSVVRKEQAKVRSENRVEIVSEKIAIFKEDMNHLFPLAATLGF